MKVAKLDGIKDVSVETRYGGHKFVVAKLEELRTGQTKLVVRASDQIKRHKQLLDSLCDEMAASPFACIGLTMDCVGGGWIAVDNANKLVQIGGESLEYGREPNREQTVAMLQAHFPGFRVEMAEQPPDKWIGWKFLAKSARS